jgi:hypothetical protein
VRALRDLIFETRGELRLPTEETTAPAAGDGQPTAEPPYRDPAMEGGTPW